MRDLNPPGTDFDVRQRLGPIASLFPTAHAADLDGGGRPNLIVDDDGAWSHRASMANWAVPFASPTPMAPVDDHLSAKRQMLALRYLLNPTLPSQVLALGSQTESVVQR